IESAQQPSVGVSSAVGVLAAAVVLFIAFGSLLAMLLPIVTSIADYALFIVTRHRRGLQSGLAPGEAAVTAIDTSGRAVLFAGITVCIALLGIFVLGVSFLNGRAVACALTVVFTVVAAVTLLPAMLGVFGMRVLSRRQRRLLAGQAAAPGSGG